MFVIIDIVSNNYYDLKNVVTGEEEMMLTDIGVEQSCLNLKYLQAINKSGVLCTSDTKTPDGKILLNIEAGKISETMCLLKIDDCRYRVCIPYNEMITFVANNIDDLEKHCIVNLTKNITLNDIVDK